MNFENWSRRTRRGQIGPGNVCYRVKVHLLIIEYKGISVCSLFSSIAYELMYVTRIPVSALVFTFAFKMIGIL